MDGLTLMAAAPHDTPEGESQHDFSILKSWTQRAGKRAGVFQVTHRLLTIFASCLLTIGLSGDAAAAELYIQEGRRAGFADDCP